MPAASRRALSPMLESGDAGTLAAVGLTALVAGFGLIWVSKEVPEIVVTTSPDRLRELSMAGSHKAPTVWSW